MSAPLGPTSIVDRPSRVVDLTQPLGPATVLWPGSRPFAADVDAVVERDGWYARSLAVPEHAGTHLDAPAHFVAAGETVEAIAADRLVAPAIVLDLSDEVGDDDSFTVEPRHVEAWERRHGRVPAGAAVLVRTGWDRHVGNGARYLGAAPDGGLRFPGLGAGTARLLVDRGVVGIGIDTLSVDAGAAADLPVHHLTLPAGLWHLEGLVGLEALPPVGALLVVGALRLVDGSGAPARVLALVP